MMIVKMNLMIRDGEHEDELSINIDDDCKDEFDE